MRILVNQTTGEFESSPWNFDNSHKVAGSRSGATDVWRLADGKLVEIQYLKSGNFEANEVSSIPDYLTVRF